MTNEAIEVHLNYLRAGFDAMHAALPALRDKIDALNEKTNSRIDSLDDKIDALNEKTNSRIDALGDKVDALNEKTNARIDALDEKLEKSNARLEAKMEQSNEKIDKLTEKVLEDRGQLKTIVLLFGLVSVIASLASIARSFGWI